MCEVYNKSVNYRDLAVMERHADEIRACRD